MGSYYSRYKADYIGIIPDLLYIGDRLGSYMDHIIDCNPDAPCMAYLPTFGPFFKVKVGE